MKKTWLIPVLVVALLFNILVVNAAYEVSFSVSPTRICEGDTSISVTATSPSVLLGCDNAPQTRWYLSSPFKTTAGTQSKVSIYKGSTPIVDTPTFSWSSSCTRRTSRYTSTVTTTLPVGITAGSYTLKYQVTPVSTGGACTGDYSSRSPPAFTAEPKQDTLSTNKAEYSPSETITVTAVVQCLAATTSYEVRAAIYDANDDFVDYTNSQSVGNRLNVASLTLTGTASSIPGPYYVVPEVKPSGGSWGPASTPVLFDVCSASEADYCDNDIDDDCDGLVDYDDPDCCRDSELGYCNNNKDDDCDGLTDCQDPDCAGSISGNVQDAETSDAIFGARIDAVQDATPKYTEFTQASGNYQIDDVLCGPYGMIASAEEYVSSTQAIELQPNQQLENVDFTLTLGTTCEDDCTYTGDNTIHRECDTINGCEFCDAALGCGFCDKSKVGDSCDLAQPGWIREYYDETPARCNDGCEIECAEECPKAKLKKKAKVTCEEENLIKITKLVQYKGALVKLVIVTCG